ncbi:MAG: DNA-3-methyladenine glycosylase [Pirellulaceae bacterium]|nr:DNA-3-methyladenine glycosylase [Pirellulaceae bacterium]
MPRAFYDRPVVRVARELIGCLLVRETIEGLLVGRIVEAEAYLSQRDAACHAAAGQTRRNSSMFGPPGHAYVYAIHARYCLNAVTEPAGTPSAVLIRAVEPLAGLSGMRQRRGREAVCELARGPGRLCEAFAIDRQLDGSDLTRGTDLWIAQDGYRLSRRDLARSPRIGVTSAHDLPLRFFLDGSRFVSGPRKLHRRPVR